MPVEKGRPAEKSPCSVRERPVPEQVPCSRCGQELEVWSDEASAVCPACRQTVTREKTLGI